MARREARFLTVAFRGFDDARTRYAAFGPGALALAPLSEALYWTAVIDDYVPRGTALRSSFERDRARHADGKVVPGVRYVRNALTHGYAVVTRAAGLTDGMFDDEGYMDFGPDVWVGVDEVPPPKRFRPDERARYADALAGRSPASTLDQLARWHDRLAADGWSSRLAHAADDGT